MVKASIVDRVIVGTIIMPEAIAHPTDSPLLEKSRQHLLQVAEEHGLSLRQNDNRIAPRLVTPARLGLIQSGKAAVCPR